LFHADVKPAIDKVNQQLREVGGQLTRLQPGEKSCRDEIEELKRRQRGEIDFTDSEPVVKCIWYYSLFAAVIEFCLL